MLLSDDLEQTSRSMNACIQYEISMSILRITNKKSVSNYLVHPANSKENLPRHHVKSENKVSCKTGSR